jgi:translation initiation factor IF-3
MNEQIRVPQVRLINEENEQLGIVATRDALMMARDVGLDLVEVAPQSKPPVCRLMDYGKFKYDQKKKAHKAKVKQHAAILKEVRLRPKTDAHDRDFKLKQARGFLEKGDKVQFTMLFRGREMIHMDRAQEMFVALAQELLDVARVESEPRRMGRRMTMVVTPDKGKAKTPEKTDKPEPAAEPDIARETGANAP